jgi:hypothetical protein
MTNWMRRYKTRGHSILLRRMIPVSYTREQAVGLTAFCRKYGIVGQYGNPRGVEAVRFLLVVALTPGADVRTRAAVAAQINLKAMVNSVANRASRVISGTIGNEDETEMVVKPRLFIRVDQWLAGQLSYHARNYRDGEGGILDNKMVYEFTLRGMADPDLHGIASVYSKLIYPMRNRMLQLEEAIRESVMMVKQEWQASMGQAEMPATLEEG